MEEHLSEEKLYPPQDMKMISEVDSYTKMLDLNCVNIYRFLLDFLCFFT